jgi:hypothetical protein
MKTNINFWSYLAQFFLEWEMFQIEVVEKKATHILCSTFFLENRTVYEIMWKNIVQWEPSRAIRTETWLRNFAKAPRNDINTNT